MSSKIWDCRRLQSGLRGEQTVNKQQVWVKLSSAVRAAMRTSGFLPENQQCHGFPAE